MAPAKRGVAEPWSKVQAESGPSEQVFDTTGDGLGSANALQCACSLRTLTPRGDRPEGIERRASPRDQDVGARVRGRPAHPLDVPRRRDVRRARIALLRLPVRRAHRRRRGLVHRRRRDGRDVGRPGGAACRDPSVADDGQAASGRRSCGSSISVAPSGRTTSRSRTGTSGSWPRTPTGSAKASAAPCSPRCSSAPTPTAITAVLLTESPENVAFYRAIGFDVTAEPDIPGGPPVWVMHRPPQA